MSGGGRKKSEEERFEPMGRVASDQREPSQNLSRLEFVGSLNQPGGELFTIKKVL